MKRTIRKIVSVVLALAMVVTGINYTPSTVKADGTITNNGKTYTINSISGSIDGLVVEPRNDNGFRMAWAAASGNTITVSENKVTLQESISNDGNLLISALESLSTGTHTLTFTSNTNVVSTATLTIEGGSSGGDSGDTEESPTAPESATWTAWGTSTEYSYYLASGNIKGDMSVDNQGLYVALNDVPSIIRLNGVTVTNMMGSGAHAKISLENFTQKGIYKLYLATSTAEIATIYIQKGESSSSGGETEDTTDPYKDVTTDLDAPTDVYLYNFTQENNGYKLTFNVSDNSSVIGEVTGTDKYVLYINGAIVKEITTSDLSVSSKGVASISLSEEDIAKNTLTKGNQYSIEVREIYTVPATTEGDEDKVYYSPKSATTTFMYNKVDAPYADDVPQIFVTTSKLADGSADDTSGINLFTDITKRKVNASIVVKDATGANTAYSNTGTIKVRGNSTALTEKKPYNISFSKKTDLFGMGEAKKWSLLANAFDKTLVRNKLAMDFLRTLENAYTPMNAYTSQCKFVDLYVDGTYLGNYLLIESVETGSTRVDINDKYVDKKTDDATKTSTPTTVTINGTKYSVYDALLELANDVVGHDMEHRYDPEAYYFKTEKFAEIFSVNSPEKKNPLYGYKETELNKPAWVSGIKTFLDGFESALNQSATTDADYEAQYKLIEQFIDVESFVNFYITEEYFMCKDVNFSSTRFYIKDGKLYAGPLWDLDLSSGNIVDHKGHEGYYAQSSETYGFRWFNKLMSNKYFKEKVVSRYTAIQPLITELYAENGTMDKEINAAKKSIDRNYATKDNGGAGWELYRKYTGDDYSNQERYNNYDSYISYLRNWLSGRNTWLMAGTQWNITEEDVNNTTVSPVSEVSIRGFRASGSGYKVSFTDADADLISTLGTKSYDVYITKTNENSTETEKVLLGTVAESGKYISTTDVDTFMNDQGFGEGTYNVYIQKKVQYNGKTYTSAYSAKGTLPYQNKDYSSKTTYGIPQIYIETDSEYDFLFTDATKAKKKGTIQVLDKEGNLLKEDYGTINVRGNSTSTAQKKPYNIKFNSKLDLFGMGAAKKWSLLANTFDKSLLRNQIAYGFQRELEEITGNQFTSGTISVDLILNGKYLGTYLLAESVETGSSRVNIDADNPNTDEALIEINAEAKSTDKEGMLEDNGKKTLAYYFTLNAPEKPGTNPTSSGYDTQEELNAATEKFNNDYSRKLNNVIGIIKNFEKAIGIQYGTPGEIGTITYSYDTDIDEIAKYIDVDSFVDFYITAELFSIEDIAYDSTRFYTKTDAKGNTKLYAGPLWDADLSSGNDGSTRAANQELHAQQMVWFKALMNNAYFKLKVYNRYLSLQSKIKALYTENGTIDTEYNKIKNSAEANYSAAYNVYAQQNGAIENIYSTDKTLNTGWNINLVYASGEIAQVPTYQFNTVTGSKVIYDKDSNGNATNLSANYYAYVNAFKEWLNARNTYLLQQFKTSETIAQVADADINIAKGKTATVFKWPYTDGTEVMLTNGRFGFDDANVCAIINNTEREYVNEKGETVKNWSNREEVYAVIDLGKYYDASTLDKILIQYKDTKENDTVAGKKYKVEYSVNGEDYYTAVPTTTVATLPSDTYTLDDVSGVAGTVRYVKVYFEKSATYGMQIGEIAVLDTDGDKTIVTPPSSIVVEREDTSTNVNYNDVIVSWPAINGATGYRITYTPAVEAVQQSSDNSYEASVMALTLSEDNSVSPLAEDATETIIINDSDATSYNFTNNGINLKEGSTVTIEYTADAEVNDSSTFTLIDESDPVTSNISEVSAKATVTVQTASIVVTVKNTGAAMATNVPVIIKSGETVKASGTIDSIAAGSTGTVTLEITETTSGKFTYDVFAGDSATCTVSYRISDNHSWKQISGSNYYYYLPSGTFSNTNNDGTNIIVAYGSAGFTATKVTVDETVISAENYTSNNSVEFKIKSSIISEREHPYKVDVFTTSSETPYFTVYLKEVAPLDYKPTGFLATVDNNGNMNIKWNTTFDADAAAATYEVKVGTESATVTGSSAVYALGTNYGEYTVTLTTKVGTETKDTQTLTINYKDPDSVGGTLTVVENWEAQRNEALSWTEITNATGYGIYVDGKLYKTTTSTNGTVPAYVFAEKSGSVNGEGVSQPTTVGEHYTTVLALFNDEVAPELLADGDEKHIVGSSHKSRLYVNYIFGTGTKLWNKSISDNEWNFTICEEAGDKGVTEGALAKVNYGDDGSTTIEFVNMGANPNLDSSNNRQQPWTIKGALYDIPTENNKDITVQFDIIGPAVLAEKKTGYPGEPEGEEKTQGITINFTPEEIVNGTYGAAYNYEKYYFEPAKDEEGNDIAVLHYSRKVTTTNTSYDLLFGLGDLVFGDSADKTLTLTNPTSNTVYGVDTVSAKGIYVSDTKGSIYTNFTSTVPNRQEDNYTYNVMILDGETVVETQKVNDPSSVTFTNGDTGYVPGKEYTVKVESVYTITDKATATKTTKVTIPTVAPQNADLVISSAINARPADSTSTDTVFRAGETVEVKVTVSNIGNIASAATKIGLYKEDIDGTPLLVQKDVPEIPAGGSVTITFTNTLENEAKYYPLIAKVNAEGTAAESDYTNNSKNIGLKAYAPVTDDLTVVNTTDAHNIIWSSVNDAISYEIKYTKEDGTIATAIISSAISYQLTQLPKEGTQIELWAIEADGTKYKVKYATTKADLIISDVKMISTPPVDSYYRVGDQIKYEVTMTNIGLEKAVSADGSITIHLVGGPNNTKDSMALKEYLTEINGVKINNIERGGSVTATFTRTLTEIDLGDVYFGGRADADNEIDETNEDNNYKILDTLITIKEALSENITFSNDGTNVTASWPALGEEITGELVISYISGGVTYEENVGDATSYVFPEEHYPDNNSKVTVNVKEENGSLLNVALGTARADMVISNISVPKPYYTVGETVSITATMKNIGVANAKISSGNIVQKLVINDTVSGLYSDTGIQKFDIGEEKQYTFTYTIKAEDVLEDGTVKISSLADADGVIAEGEIGEKNNYSDVITITVTEPATLTLQQQDVDVENGHYGNGNVEVVWSEAMGATAYEIVYHTGATYKPVQDTSATRVKVLKLENRVETDDKITYTSDGNTLVYDKTKKTYTYVFTEPLDNKSTVTVRVSYEEEVTNESVYFDYASAQAMVDLIVTDLDVTGDRVKEEGGKKVVPVKIPFNLQMNVRNIGTATVSSAGDKFETYYGGWNMTSLIQQENVPGIVGNENTADGGVNTAYWKGIKPGEVIPVTIANAKVKARGDYTLKVKTDAPGFIEAENTGYFDESDEKNNFATVDVTADYDQQKMDWVPLHYSEDDDLVKNGTVQVTEKYPFKIAATDTTIEYKILDTSIPDLDYSDIITRYCGYANTHISIGFNSEYTIVETHPYQYKYVGEGKGNYVAVKDSEGNIASYTQVAENQGDYVVESNISNTVTQYTQVIGDYANNYGNSSFVPDFRVIQTQGCYINNWLTTPATILEPTANTQIGYVGNAFNFNAESWGLGKYYVMKLKTGPESNADWVEVAFRVTTDGGQWIKANASDGTDANKLPFYYHDTTYETKGAFFYDASDMLLSNITSYNGNHLAIQLDNSKVPDLTKLNWRVAITNAEVDENGNFQIPTTDDNNYEMQFEAATDGVIGVQGTGRLLMRLPDIMRELPVHSDNGGTRDADYFFMKIFYDTTDASNPYIAIPIKIDADIPMIEEVHGMAVSARGDNLSVQWANTTTQDVHGYTYDVYIRDVKNDGEFVKVTDTPVIAGTYNFTGYNVQTIGNEYEIKVVGKWGGHCQITEKTMTYKVTAPEENRDYITDETFNYNSLSDDKWIPLSGENYLPIHLENTVSSTINADIYYYTDKDLDKAVGYNGAYISLGGNTKYFTGNTSTLYVRDGNTYKFESRNIYDNFYKGQILMNAAELFSTYGGYSQVSDLYNKAMYYTVRVYGENGSTYKDYYFKAIPRETASEVVKTSGEWRHISGEYELPVTFSDLTLDGDIYFYDYESKTNTYDIKGYNGYYMSLIGNGTYYKSGTTTVQISKPISMAMASDFDNKIDTNNFDTDKYIEKAKNGKLYTVYKEASYTSDENIYDTKNVYESVYDGFMNVKASDIISVSYGTNFYILKISSGDNVTYVPMKVVVKSGDVEVQGFQINYDKSAGSASEFNPATRVVSRASKVMAIKDTLHRVTEHGTVFGVSAYAGADEMTIDSSNQYVSHMATTAKGLYNGYVSGLNDDKTYNYYAFTIRWVTYNYSALTTKYSYRAYAKLDNGEVVYGHKVYSVNTYEVAENLYNNSKMPNLQAHNFLYDNILNLVDLGNNRKYISYAMMRALNVKYTSDPNYTLINTVYQDIYDYVRCFDEAYTYQDRKPFACKSSEVEEKLLKNLNAASRTKYGEGFVDYTSLIDWIENETGNYGQASIPSYPGCYKRTDFGWGSNIFTDYDSE